MTKKEALKILIESASRDIRGDGCGIKMTTEEWRTKVKVAIERLWKDATGREMRDADRFNTF